jgi:hypothetical protein
VNKINDEKKDFLLYSFMNDYLKYRNNIEITQKRDCQAINMFFLSYGKKNRLIRLVMIMEIELRIHIDERNRLFLIA